MKATEGYVCLFTLKNPSFPEYINYCDSGAMCLDIHSSRSNFIVVGRYDGSVAVYNAHLPIKEAQFESNSVTNKHGGIVWQVRSFDSSLDLLSSSWSYFHQKRRSLTDRPKTTAWDRQTLIRITWDPISSINTRYIFSQLYDKWN